MDRVTITETPVRLRTVPRTHILVVGSDPKARERARLSLRRRGFAPVVYDTELEAAQWVADHTKEDGGKRIPPLIGELVLMDGLSWRRRAESEVGPVVLAETLQSRSMLLLGMFAVAYRRTGNTTDNPFEPARLFSYRDNDELDHLGERFERAIGKQIIQ